MKYKNLPFIKTNKSFVKSMFSPFPIINLKKLYSNIYSTSSFKLFRKQILELTRHQHDNNVNVRNTLGLTYLTRAVVDLSHSRGKMFYYTFWDSLNPIFN